MIASCETSVRHVLKVLVICISSMSAMTIVLAQENPVEPPTRTVIPYYGEPIEVTIAVDQQSSLMFPWAVRPKTTADMVNMTKLVAIGDSVFITPLSDFKSKDYYFEDKASGAMIQMKITASKDGAAERFTLTDGRGDNVQPVLPDEGGQPANAQALLPRESTRSEVHSGPALARFGMQNIVVPDERLVEPLSGISEITRDEYQAVTDMIVGASGDTLAKPVREWKTSDGMYVIGVGIRNLSERRLVIDQTNMRYVNTPGGGSSLWSNVLAPRGSVGDTTAIVVVSEVPWADLPRRGY